MNNLIEALKERLRSDCLGACFDEGYNYGVEDCINTLDTFQKERQWHDPAEKLPEDGQAVWIVKWERAIPARYLAWDNSDSPGLFEADDRLYRFDSFIWTERYVDEAPPLPEEDDE